MVYGEVSEFSATPVNLGLAMSFLEKRGASDGEIVAAVHKIKFCAALAGDVNRAKREADDARREFERDVKAGTI